jgi:hypothetical protein
MRNVNPDGFFYDKRHALTLTAAQKVLRIVCDLFGAPRSVLDVGCGVGTWLAVAQANGAAIEGVEGAWISGVDDLAVGRELIKVDDLEGNWTVSGRFDLAICLEVAEHLSPDAGSRLVDTLCAASPLVLFSAAIPGQGGNGHVNEQWPEYWQQEFARWQYRALDCVRPRIWEDADIPWWYRQNIVLFASKDHAHEYFSSAASKDPQWDTPVLGLIHPSAPSCRSSEDISSRAALSILLQRLSNAFNTHIIRRRKG